MSHDCLKFRQESPIERNKVNYLIKNFRKRYCRVEKCSEPLYKHTSNRCNGTQPEIFPPESGVEIGHSECTQDCGGGFWKFVKNCKSGEIGCKNGKIERLSEEVCNTHPCEDDIRCSRDCGGGFLEVRKRGTQKWLQKIPIEKCNSHQCIPCFDKHQIHDTQAVAGSYDCNFGGDREIWKRKSSENCWWKCGEKGGRCDVFCGQGNFCCSKLYGPNNKKVKFEGKICFDKKY